MVADSKAMRKADGPDQDLFLVVQKDAVTEQVISFEAAVTILWLIP